jgi:hypothetical protein
MHGRPVATVGIFLFFIALTLAACEDSTLTLTESGLWGGPRPIAVTDSGRWGTVKSAEAAASCTAAALGNEVTVHRIAAAPKQTIEIHSKVMQAGAPVYIITVTRVDSGLTMIELRASDHKASLRAKAAAESCIG